MNIRTISGIVLLLLGACLFLNQGETFGPGEVFTYFWPSIFVIPLALFFHWMYFSMLGRKGLGLLIPGGILFGVGIVCQIGMLFNNWSYIWPGYILSVAAGLFEFYWFGKRNKWLLIPINILTVLSILFFVAFSIGSIYNRFVLSQPIFAIVFILAGALILLMKKKDV